MEKSKRRKQTKHSNTRDVLLAAASAYRQLLETGRVVCIDPSSGSQSSQPGFALFAAGILQASGTLKVTPDYAPSRRYRQLLAGVVELRDKFQPDVLIIEKLPLFMGSGGRMFNQQGVVNLHRSVGVIMAGMDCERVLEVSPATWHTYLRNLGKEALYRKTDSNDAIVLGLTVFAKLGITVKEVAGLYKTPAETVTAPFRRGVKK
jgi:hypothetical protein